jgi:hypothetical protein
MSENDQQLLKRMLDAIGDLRRGLLPLGKGADTLLFLLNGLAKKDPKWAREVTQHIEELERANLATPAQRRQLGRSYEGTLRQTLHDLERLVRAKLPGGGGPVPPAGRA